MKNLIPVIALAGILAVSQTACLKTRSQIKSNDSAESGDTQGDETKAGAPRGGHYEVEELKNEMTRMSGKLEELEHNQRAHNVGDLKEYTARLDGRISELEKNQMLVMAELKALKDKETATATAVREAAVPSTDVFAHAYKLLAERKCDEAAEKFRSILNRGSKGKDAAEAHFGLGEAEYCLKNYKKAIVQYDKVKDADSKSKRMPTSLYKIGLAFGYLNMPKEAKGFFAELTEKYPKSPEAKKARAKVKE